MGLLIQVRVRCTRPGLVTRIRRSAAGLWFPDVDQVVDRRQNVLAVVRRLAGPGAGRRLVVPAANIITDAGDVYLAQRSAGEAPTDAFGVFELGSAGTPGKAANRSGFTAIAATQLANDATYPKTNDGDSDNTGAGTEVATRRATYSAASFNHAAITHGWITNTSPGASEPLYAGWAWAATINKTASDTLKVIHNSDLEGV